MNKSLVLDWLLEHAEKNEHLFDRAAKLEEALYELSSQKELALPPSLPRRSEKMIPVLRDHFKNNVTFISLALHHYFPKRYLFYRVSCLEDEISEGFEFLSEIAPQLAFPFSKIGRGNRSFDRYLQLNQALLEFARIYWPELKKPQARLVALLYEGLGRLFLEKSDYHRYWIMATKEEYFEDLDTEEETVWSGRKEMQSGDLVFMYRMSPRKAITDIYRLKEEPRFDPWGGWDGFWVDMLRVCAIEDITFAEMRKDSILSQWNVVRRNFQWTITEPVPHAIYNRLLEKIPEAIKRKHKLKPEPVATVGRSGQFTSEAEFEEEVIVPLLKRWGFRYKTQYPCLFRVGSQYHRGRVDFHVSDERGPLTLFEDKFRILNDKDLEQAVDQAKSYALLLGLPSFVVASPEGIWLYSLDRNQEELVKQLSADGLQDHDKEIRSLLLKLRQ